VRSVEFHPEAQDEFISVAQFYESQTKDSGSTSSSQFNARTSSCGVPGHCPPFGRRLRRLLVPKFPYGLLYCVEPERIYIVAVMHLHRRPGYWRSRL
jgi:toxin ParE1/3/4